MVSGADEDGGAPEQFSSLRSNTPRSNIPRSIIPRSMATLLTPVETPLGGQSCASVEVGRRVEVPPGESVTGRASGMSEAGMKGRQKEAIGSGEYGQEADWTPKKTGRVGMTILLAAADKSTARD